MPIASSDNALDEADWSRDEYPTIKTREKLSLRTTIDNGACLQVGAPSKAEFQVQEYVDKLLTAGAQ